MGIELDSRSKGRRFESCPLLDGNDVKVMAGSIITPNPGSYSKEKKKLPNGAHQKIILKKTICGKLACCKFVNEIDLLLCIRAVFPNLFCFAAPLLGIEYIWRHPWLDY